MNLIYYYHGGTGSPSVISRVILNNLIKKEDSLPFKNIILYTEPKYIKNISINNNENIAGTKVIGYKELNQISKEDLIHIPVSPYVSPNSKFLLYMYGIMNKNKMILQYHGDIRKEFINQVKYHHQFNIVNSLSFIGIPYILRSADRLVVNSYTMARLINENYKVRKYEVIPNGIEEFWFNIENNVKSELDGNPSILYHGRLSREKGVDLLIKGFSKAIQRPSKAKLYILGNGPQIKYLKNLCSKYNIEKNVIFLGHVKNVEYYLSNVDAAIYPSIFEAFSVAILEAFASAKGPVYYSRKAGINDFVKKSKYNLNSFEPNEENITGIIESLINKNIDYSIAKKQKEFAKEFKWDEITDSYIKLYKDLINQEI